MPGRVDDRQFSAPGIVMADPLLLLPWATDPAYAPRQQATIEFVEEEAPHLVGWEIRRLRCPRVNRFAYAQGLVRAWDRPGTLVVLEHDVVPLPGQLQELAACPEPICLVNYPITWCHYRAVARKEGAVIVVHGAVCIDHARIVNAYRVRDPTAPGGFSFGADHLRFADLFSLGCTKFSEEARQAVIPDPGTRFEILDDTLARAFAATDYRVHIHYPDAGHNHSVPQDPHPPVTINGVPTACTWIGNVAPELRDRIRSELAEESLNTTPSIPA